MLLAQGLDIKRSVLAFWVGYAAAQLRPVFLRLRELILASGKIAVDETEAPVLGHGAGPTRPPLPTPTLRVVARLKLLDGYRGIVQCDGYAAYKTIANTAPGEAITLAFCWAHLRRRFSDLAKEGDAPIASEALGRIAVLYAIEKTIRGYGADARRKRSSVPTLKLAGRTA
jgi:hypothetical protein